MCMCRYVVCVCMCVRMCVSCVLCVWLVQKESMMNFDTLFLNLQDMRESYSSHQSLGSIKILTPRGWMAGISDT